jgi:hypothetical protein
MFRSSPRDTGEGGCEKGAARVLHGVPPGEPGSELGAVAGRLLCRLFGLLLAIRISTADFLHSKCFNSRMKKST